VRGALLIFPADPEQRGGDAEDFAPLPKAMLPFPSIVVAAADHRVTVDRHREMAAHWLSDFVTVDRERSFSQSHRHDGEQLLELLQAGGPGLSRYTYRAEPVIQPAARRSSSRSPVRRSA
jgi:predicted alpha/beta hydrolase family esterase